MKEFFLSSKRRGLEVLPTPQPADHNPLTRSESWLSRIIARPPAAQSRNPDEQAGTVSYRLALPGTATAFAVDPVARPVARTSRLRAAIPRPGAHHAWVLGDHGRVGRV